MKNALAIIALIVLLGFCLMFYLRGKEESKKLIESERQAQQDTLIAKSKYLALRQQVFGMTAEKLNLEMPEDGEKAIGVMFEIGNDTGTISVVAFGSGDASIYTNTGGGVIGGIAHEDVKNAAIKLIKSSQNYIGYVPVATDINLPKAGDIKFFIITSDQRYSFETTAKELSDPSSQYAEIFSNANDLITQLRMITQH